MNQILDMLMHAAGSGATQQVSQRFGLSEKQTGSAIEQLVPALLAGMQRNTTQQGGLDSLLGAITRGSHGQYLDRPELLGEESTVQDGNSILGHVLGNKDVSRAVASRAAEQTGIGADVMKKMLPLVATMVMGALSKQTSAPAANPLGSGAAGLISSLLRQDDSDTPGSDALGMLGRLLGGR
jgi:hypothetical protein